METETKRSIEEQLAKKQELLKEYTQKELMFDVCTYLAHLVNEVKQINNKLNLIENGNKSEHPDFPHETE